MLELGYYEKDRVYIVMIEGELVFDSVAYANEFLKPLIDDIKNGSIMGMVFDCQKLQFVDSAGIGLICGKHVGLKRENKRLVLCRLADRLEKIFLNTKLAGKLSIYGSLDVAIRTVGIKTPGLSEATASSSSPSLTPGEQMARELLEGGQGSGKSLNDFIDHKKR